jgi:hypothetical protein
LRTCLHLGVVPGHCEQLQQTTSLFDQLVRAGKQHGRHIETKCFRGFEIDH